MGSHALLACVLALTALASGAPAGHADTPAGEGPVLGRGLVKQIRDEKKVRSIVELRPGHPVSGVASAVERASAGAKVLESAESGSFFVAEVDAAALAELRKDARVKAVYADRLSVPHLARSTKVIGSDVANAAGWTGSGSTVAVLDMGIDGDHPFLAGRVVDQACFSTTDPGSGAVSLCPGGLDTQSGPGAADTGIRLCMAGAVNQCGHGTHVAGIAAGLRVPGAPSDGVAPGAKVLPIQVFSRIDSAATCASVGVPAPCFVSYTSDQKLALEYVTRMAKTHNIASVNLSLGGGHPYTAHCDADPEAAALKSEFDALLEQGVAPVVAAGNGVPGNTGVTSPACVSSAVAVGATDNADQVADFSNRGPLLDLFAPGADITSSVPDDTYAALSGTSMSAPHVAGSFAVLKQAYPALDAARILELLRETGRQVASGVPRIDLAQATSAAAKR